MKSLYVADLPQQENQLITSFFLVQSKSLRSTREGKPYLALRLADRTGTVEARMWEEAAEVEPEFDQHDVVKVEANVEPYRNQLQLKIRRLRRARAEEVELEDYLPHTAQDVEALYAELLEVARGLANPHLRALLLAVLDDPEVRPRLKRAPGAKTIHHAYIGGLLEHIVSLCRLCRLVVQNYPEVDLDLLLTGAVLHDLGKIYELSYDRSLDYTTEGNLLGHIALAQDLLTRKMDSIEGFPPRLRSLVLHLLLSHHGRLEFGSPVTPKVREAVLLHYLDDLDSKMEAVRSSLAAADAAAREGDWTEWNRALERPLLRREQFLAGETPPEPAPPQSESGSLFDPKPTKK
ncbi:MAG TPA: HD domain-containing protein [Candidatus Xenobia bacterium]|nr:HD domain-containing protein [Candidatus Xenobia bacterium]